MFRLFRIQVGFACLLCVLFAPVGCNKQSETDSVRHKTPIGEKTGQNTESSKTVAAKDSTKQTEEAEPVSNEHLVVTADWPQFRGANRDGRSTETGLLESWPKQGPPLVWTFAKAGVGYSGPAIVGDRLYIMGAREGTEFLIAINTKNGEEEWAVKIGPMFTWKGNNWNRGPSATPTIAGDHIYALGGQGILVCVDKDGKEVWRVDLPAKLGAVVNNIGGAPEKIGWGFAWSPLVDGDHLICQPGGKQGTLAALNKHTGEVVWRSQSYNDEASYASPVVAYIDGVKQYINLTNEGLTSVSPKDGSVLWRWERKPPYNDCVIGTPIVWGNYVYASVGFGNGCDLIQIKNKKVTPLYSSRTMQNQTGGVVLDQGHIFGFTSGKKSWICQNLKTGEDVWSERRKLREGSILYADKHFYLYEEQTGTLVLIEANTKEWVEKGRFTIPKRSQQNLPSGKIWTHPVISHGKLYLRDQELLFCFNVAKN